MYGKKANNLTILKNNNFNVPEFLKFSEKTLSSFNDIKKNLDLPIIIRSSYSLEDGNKNAFAGIFESYFPIYNDYSFKKGLNICLNADNLNKFKLYIKVNNIDISNMKKNFIVQEFIAGDFSGVCFTKNNNNEIVIEIIPGINEPLVQGDVLTPFSIKVKRNDIKNYEITNFYMDSTFKVLNNKKIITKKFKLYTFEEDILLNFKDKLLYQFLKIEKLFGYPQDIEFTVKGNDIYILQSRDITIL